MLQRVLDRQGHAAAEGAEAGLLHGIEQIGDELAVDLVAAVVTGFGDEFFAACAAEAAGEAFAAAFIRGELKEMLDVLDHWHGFGDADDTSVAEQKARFLEAFEINGELGDVAHGDETAERSADLDGFDLGFETASEVDDGLQRRAHGDFVDAGLREMAVE